MDIPFDCCLYSKEDVKFDKVAAARLVAEIDIS